VAVLWDREELEFWTNEQVYSMPDYLPGREVLDRHIHELDVRDGAVELASVGCVLALAEVYDKVAF
jgi:hypothetical protein